MDACIQVRRKHYEPMNPSKVNFKTVQSREVTVMVWEVCSWRDISLLIRLKMTLTYDRYVSIPIDHLHPFISIVHSDRFGQFLQDTVTYFPLRVALELI
ncbi:uncharacterized protein TNCV_2076631 [Trichonephila clavipes]|nr:uncharacterized protein TNCV_2076631 [Trichonephila clavipes]